MAVPMARHLPPLNGLRAFEAAARHLSFTRAAEELNVTQTAISHRIRALEERLGVRLFRRLPRGLVLSEEAQLFLPPVRDAFDQIAAATERLSKEQTGGVLTVSVLPSFAAKWLVPRLGRFRAAHPDIDLRITAALELVDFARDDVDVAIRCGRGHYPGLRVQRLFGETIYPVCSPLLLEGPQALRRPADLGHHTLLHDDDTSAWQLWLEHAGVEGADSNRGRSSAIPRCFCRRRSKATAWRSGGAGWSRPIWRPAVWSGRSRSACHTSSPSFWSALLPTPSGRRLPPSAAGCWRRRSVPVPLDQLRHTP